MPTRRARGRAARRRGGDPGGLTPQSLDPQRGGPLGPARLPGGGAGHVLPDRLRLRARQLRPDQFVIIGELMKKFDHCTAPTRRRGRDQGRIGRREGGITGYRLGSATGRRADSKGLGLNAASGYHGGGILNHIEFAPQVPIECISAITTKTFRSSRSSSSRRGTQAPTSTFMPATTASVTANDRAIFKQ